MDGLPETQLRSVADLHERISYILTATLPEVEHAERLCRAASIEENDYTVYTFEDLAFEAGLVRDNVGKKRAFLENQVRAHRDCGKCAANAIDPDRSADKHQAYSLAARRIRVHIPAFRPRSDEYAWYQ